MNRSPAPVVLVHGWGGSYATTWQRNGFTALLEDAGVPIIGVDLLGHGTAPKPHDAEAYADLSARIVEVMPDEPVDAIGFSLGAMTLLRLAVDRPERFQRLVLAGIGSNVFDRDDSGTQAIIAGLDAVAAGEDPSGLDNTVRLFTQYASQPGNDIAALTAVLRRAPGAAVTPADCARVTCPVLVVVGDQDFVHPADELAAAFPNGSCQTLRNVDHFATTDSFGFFDAALEFLDAVC
jgi:pimeloyl-ACP methyl ester carboxylesterase